VADGRPHEINRRSICKRLQIILTTILIVSVYVAMTRDPPYAPLKRLVGRLTARERSSEPSGSKTMKSAYA